MRQFNSTSVPFSGGAGFNSNHTTRRRHQLANQTSQHQAISLFDDPTIQQNSPPTLPPSNPNQKARFSPTAFLEERKVAREQIGYQQNQSPQATDEQSSLSHSYSVPNWSDFSSKLSGLPSIALREFNNLATNSNSPNSSVENLSRESSNLTFEKPEFQILEPDEMPSRERTAEFRTTAKSFQMKQSAMNGPRAPPVRNKNIAESAEFNQIARRIGHDLSQTCAKLEKMAELARKKSIFDDRVQEVEELTNIIKLDIQGLNKQIGRLQEFNQRRASANGGAAQSDRKQTQNHSKSVVVGLQSRLASVSNNFKSILDVRTESMKHQKSRRDRFGQHMAIPSSLPPSASTGNMGSVLLLDEQQSSSGLNANGQVALDMDAVERSRQSQQMLIQDESQGYLTQRADEMQTIEGSIVELGSIFRQLATLVSEQGETIQRIDQNVEDVSMNVEGAHMELLKYFRSIQQNRWLAMKVFGVLIVFFVIFIVFLT